MVHKSSFHFDRSVCWVKTSESVSKMSKFSKISKINNIRLTCTNSTNQDMKFSINCQVSLIRVHGTSFHFERSVFRIKSSKHVSNISTISIISKISNIRLTNSTNQDMKFSINCLISLIWGP